MPFKFVQSKSAFDVASGTTVSVTLTAAPTPGSLLVAAVAAAASEATLTGTGWTALTLASVAGGAVRMFWKIAGEGESGAYSFTLGTAADWQAAIVEYRAVGSASPVTAEVARVNGSGTVTSADATPTAGVDCLAVAFHTNANDTTFSSLGVVGGTGTGVGTVSQREYGHRTSSPITGSYILFDAEIPSPNGTYHSTATPAAAAGGGASVAFFRLGKSLVVERRNRRTAITRV